MRNNPSKRKNIFFDKIKLGDHICSIYKDKEQQFSVIVPFFKAGLSNNEKCIVITGENSKENIVLEFEKGGIEVERHAESNQLIIIEKSEAYMKGGSFNPDEMMELWKKAEQDAIKEGYSGIRVAGEASFVGESAEDSEKLMEYESELNSFFPHMKIAAVCQYNENMLKPEILAEAIHTHPHLIIYGKHHENMYYSPAADIDKKHKLPSDSYEIIRDSIIKED